MSRSRDIVEVLDAVLAVVPETESALRSELQREQRTAGFRAPEMMRDSWQACGEILGRHIGPIPKEGWHRQVVYIWTDRAAAAVAP